MTPCASLPPLSTPICYYRKPSLEKIPTNLTKRMTKGLAETYGRINDKYWFEQFSQKYQIEQLVPDTSTGSFGSIRRKEQFIIKSNKRRNNAEMAREEIKTLRRLKKYNIPYCVSQEDYFSGFQEEHYSVQKNAGLSLWEMIYEDQYQFNLFAIQSICLQLLTALAGLKKIKQVHLDIKTDNICYARKTNTIRIIDFGLSRKNPREAMDQQPPPAAFIYRAPEGVANTMIGTPFDMWSTACVIFEILTGNHLFKLGDEYHEDELSLLNAQFERLALDKTHTNTLPPKIKQNLFLMGYVNERGALNSIHPPPNQHPSLFEEFLTLDEIDGMNVIKKWELFNLLTQMLELDPTKRITPEKALNHVFFKDIFALEFEFQNLRKEDSIYLKIYIRKNDEEFLVHDTPIRAIEHELFFPNIHNTYRIEIYNPKTNQSFQQKHITLGKVFVKHHINLQLLYEAPILQLKYKLPSEPPAKKAKYE